VTEPSTEGGPSPRPPADAISSDELEFRLDVALDVERERLLFYRVVLVLEVLAAALLIRQILLWYVVR